MAEVSEDNFLLRLYEVVYKLSSIAKTQSARYKNIWNNYFQPLPLNPHIVRNIPLAKERFFTDLDYRIQTLKTVEDSMVDGFYSIKSILQALYLHLYPHSEYFKNDFSEEDQKILQYYTSREILGNLIEYNKLDRETVPLKFVIIAREYIMMKLKGVSLKDIMNNLAKLNRVVDKDSVIKTMEEVEKDGIITIEKKDDTYFYTIKTELKLSEEGKKRYNSTFRPIVDWPTQFWRSYYNIRELNLTPPEGYKFRDFLAKTLEKSATQGFSPAHFVFKNLVKYYTKIKEQG